MSFSHSNPTTSCPFDMKFDVRALELRRIRGKLQSGSSGHQEKFKSFVAFMEAAQKFEIPLPHPPVRIAAQNVSLASNSPPPDRAVIGDDAELWGWRSGEEATTNDNGDATCVRC